MTEKHRQGLIKKCFGRQPPRYDQAVLEFQRLMAARGRGAKTSHGHADGLLRSLQLMGASFLELNAGFGIGVEKYNRIASGEVRKEPGGANSKKVGGEGEQTLARFVQSLPTELGYPCGHRRQMTYLVVESGQPATKSIQVLWETKYVPFLQRQGSSAKPMAEKTFYKYMAAVRTS